MLWPICGVPYQVRNVAGFWTPILKAASTTSRTHLLAFALRSFGFLPFGFYPFGPLPAKLWFLPFWVKNQSFAGQRPKGKNQKVKTQKGLCLRSFGF
jgi:hypothetical protein